MRDQLLAAVTARLERIAAAQDPTQALKPGALADAQRLAEILRDDDGDVEARFMLGWSERITMRRQREDSADAVALIPARGPRLLPEPVDMSGQSTADALDELRADRL